ncbi:uncharacterized protein AC631_04130 [Debaryomyces fabryi]|uniref:GTP-binding protein YPT52 n=1 Tax=Debaryomyces fabryi TaxID=58627 RepID=A0A0V1PV62_9ASCO|nr:uncharacterized protein AC631_04130 [Debaryomyces fabryi]KSA00129.1 hypothetical protein AC631_04130 [Debaryomyces fabryi]CUM57013.1 unnamed protein product [Debaryomyces fabryi]
MPSLKPPPYKIVILGDSSVGKTSLVHRFTTNTFDQHTANTIGAAFITKEHHSNNNAEKKVKFEIWDTAGQERYRSLTPMYYRNAKTALICFDLSNMEETFDKAKYWIEQLQINVNDQDIQIKLIGNKSDLSELLDPSEYIASLANPIKFYKTSAKTGEGIDKLFNDVVDDIDEKFFTEYYKNQENEANNLQRSGMINVFNSRFGDSTNNNKCC